MNILHKIIAFKKEEIRALKRDFSLADFQESPYFKRPIRSLKKALDKKETINIIAEFKRRSPSKNQIASRDFNIADIAQSYAENGAAAMSILTDYVFFGGSNADLLNARPKVDIPILRKDFIIDTQQIYEARSIGADAILLIASVLDTNQIDELSTCAQELDLEVLCEIHDQDEIEKLNNRIDVIGINNRNLKDFTVDFNHSINMRKLLPENATVISESGISDPETITLLLKKEFNGFLIGESFMKDEFPGVALNRFIQLAKEI